MTTHPIVSQEEWIEARRALLAKEKAHMDANDELARQRRELPWVQITKPYLFDIPTGQVSLADLFDGRSQLFLYHFMFGPDWEEGCTGCSFLCDHVDGARQHFEHHDLSFVAVSRGPIAKLEEYRQRMGWQFRWVSAEHTDFNQDFHVSFPPESVKDGKITYNFTTQDYSADSEELPGFSVFYKDAEGQIFHTYSSFSRGGEALLGAYQFIDQTPLGRMEKVNGNLMDWVKRHDRYENDGRSEKECCGCNSTAKAA
ncbi:MAG: thioredoxin [Prosthecobacter sp.]|nr:thioredoxin [Prosthecobacter sp.]